MPYCIRVETSGNKLIGWVDYAYGLTTEEKYGLIFFTVTKHKQFAKQFKKKRQAYGNLDMWIEKKLMNSLKRNLYIKVVRY